MPEAVDIEEELGRLTHLHLRSIDTSEEEASAAFATLAVFDNGGVFTGSFDGDSPWERHNGGDELVHILKGASRLTILEQDKETVLDMTAGMLTVVPQGCWHRFHAPDGVTVLTVTPQPTDHSTAVDPR